jgi:hypothetical protein
MLNNCNASINKLLWYLKRTERCKLIQKEYLNRAKKEFIELTGKKVTWDEFARTCGIAPRALKTYRMPSSSSDFHVMSNFIRDAIERKIASYRK